MKNLFETKTVEELKQRMAQLTPNSERLWGKMNPAQMLAHCSESMEMAVGVKRLPWRFIGRIFGPFAKKGILRDDRPIRRNMPTDKSLIVTDERDIVAERQRLSEWIDRFAEGGPAGCTEHPHTFFGPLTPIEWAEFTYKHLDHHLRQFGV